MTVHIPILVQPIVDSFLESWHRSHVRTPLWIVDCTLGGGGHVAAFLKATQDPLLGLSPICVLGIDQDEEAIQQAKQRFKKEVHEGRLELVHARFSHLESILQDRQVLYVLADLGFSSDQMAHTHRGLSFQSEGPLDMRMDLKSGSFTCYELLQRMNEVDLEKGIRCFGEERFSKRIARAIVERRNQGNLPKTTQELSHLVIQAIPVKMRHQKIHAATRTFQALRILVNQELEELEQFLNFDFKNLVIGGRVAVISFHSLEDRLVKHAWKRRENFLRLTKKPVLESAEEVLRNPRARSAKLRIVEKVN